MGLLKRALKDIAKAGVPHFRGGIFTILDDVHEGTQNVRFIREAVRIDTVNELAAERAGQVEDAMFVGRIYKAFREDRRRKTRR